MVTSYQSVKVFSLQSFPLHGIIYYNIWCLSLLFSLHGKILCRRLGRVYRTPLFWWSWVYGCPCTWSWCHMWDMPSWLYWRWTQLSRYVPACIVICSLLSCKFDTIDYYECMMLYHCYRHGWMCYERSWLSADVCQYTWQLHLCMQPRIHPHKWYTLCW